MPAVTWTSNGFKSETLTDPKEPALFGFRVVVSSAKPLVKQLILDPGTNYSDFQVDSGGSRAEAQLKALNWGGGALGLRDAPGL